MRVLVTGVGGFIGSAVAQGLLASGHDVVGVDCLLGVLYPAEVKRLRIAGLSARPDFRFEHVDLRDHELGTLHIALDGDEAADLRRRFELMQSHGLAAE